MLRLFFRSDTRSPEVIFKEGFTTRKTPDAKITERAPFESDTDKSIALSRQFEVAPYFPSKNPEPILKQNSLFYGAVETGLFDAAIKKDAAKIETWRLLSRNQFLSKTQLDLETPGLKEFFKEDSDSSNDRTVDPKLKTKLA